MQYFNQSVYSFIYAHQKWNDVSCKSQLWRRRNVPKMLNIIDSTCLDELYFTGVALLMQQINAARLGWPSAAFVGTLTIGLLYAVEVDSMLNSNNYRRPSCDRTFLAITV